jgi:predicted MPP superfamily phosphohydrolase
MHESGQLRMRVMSIFSIILGILFLSQFYWAWVIRNFLRKRIRNGRIRVLAGTALALLYLFLLAYNFGWIARRHQATHLTLADALFTAPFTWWAASSMVGFMLVILLAPVKGVARLATRRSPSRRQFLERTATLVTATPFIAGAYGLFYGRVNLQTPLQRIHLPRLPKAFHGFRIAQMSDIHIGPFMTENEIRKYVEIANSLKPDLTVLTGDFVTFDPTTADAVVRALSGARAPFGVFGCMGNHDAWTRVQDYLTLLFRQAGIHILRGERVEIARGGETFNLIGVDFQSPHQFGPSAPTLRLLSDAERLRVPGQCNILLSHNPDTFDRAAELEVDLSLAGHTHGGQAALEFISPELAPSRLVTPYVSGLFQKPGGQLYVNRGIGTIGIPIRVGAPPEITLFELVRA